MCNMILKFILFYLLLCAINLILANPYCDIKCKNGTHTVCELKPCGLGPLCGDGAKMLQLSPKEREFILDLHNKYRNKLASGYDSRGGNQMASNMKALPCPLGWYCGSGSQMIQLTDDERQLMLDEHNKFREKVASGQDTRGGNGAASNMNALSYDLELEFIAQCYANSCAKGHDKCRNTAKMSVGQNIYTAKGSSMVATDKKYMLQAVSMWYEEITLTTKEMIDKYYYVKNTGHYTQLVWGKTTLVGCGRILKEKNHMSIICNYGVSGNLLGANVYKFGAAASECGSLAPGSEYKSLCGEPKIIPFNNPPFTLKGSYLSGNKIIVLIGIMISIFYFRFDSYY